MSEEGYWGDYSGMVQSAAAAQEPPAVYVKPARYAVIYIYPPGARPKVHYTRPRADTKLAQGVLALQRKARRGGYVSPYSISTLPEHVS